jgi:hypothetical protein
MDNWPIVALLRLAVASTEHHAMTLRRRCGSALVALGLLPALALLPGCSLLSLESPAEPLTSRELNVRLQTREYAHTFTDEVERAADHIAAKSADPKVQAEALRWKIQAAAASRRAATQMSPDMALLDIWALAAQMRELFGRGGACAAIFGGQQNIARNTSGALEKQIVEKARVLAPGEQFAQFQAFVAAYVRDSPLTSLDFTRASVASLWLLQTKEQASLISTVGTVPQVMSDMSDRMRLYSDQMPEETLWRTELSLLEAGYGSEQWRSMTASLDKSLAEIGDLANDSPALMRESLGELRETMLITADRFDATWVQMVQAVHMERDALARNIANERASLTRAVDLQRAALAEDASRLLRDVTESTGRQVRALLRDIVVYALAAFLVLLGVPFAAGYYLGRARAAR